jgi:hypothetical protein
MVRNFIDTYKKFEEHMCACVKGKVTWLSCTGRNSQKHRDESAGVGRKGP